MAETIVEVRNLKQHFRINSHFTVKAVDGISFSILKNEIFALVGESGSGKSTVARSLIGAYPPTDGEIYFYGKDITDRANRRKHSELLHRNMQIIFQDSSAALNQRMTVEKIIKEPLTVNHIYKDKKQLESRVDELLEQVGLNATYRKKYPPEISGGQRQRVAIARALINEPKILLADEPTGNLDANNAWEIMKLLDEINKRGTTVLVVSHNMEIVEAMKKRVITLQQGHVVSDVQMGGEEDEN